MSGLASMSGITSQRPFLYKKQKTKTNIREYCTDSAGFHCSSDPTDGPRIGFLAYLFMEQELAEVHLFLLTTQNGDNFKLLRPDTGNAEGNERSKWAPYLCLESEYLHLHYVQSNLRNGGTRP